MSVDHQGESSSGIGNVVASHYNSLEEKGVVERRDSRIIHMRNFNNWVKSMLLNEYLDKIKASAGRDNIKVMDLGCGKGGDLQKWQRGGVKYVACVDIAATSIEQCQSRYREMRGRNRDTFNAEFHAVDCTKQRCRDFYKDKDITFDLVSCQFALHYCFESLPQAECMLRNAAENLKLGGFFIGTTPDAFDIMSRLRQCNSNKFGNDIFSITFPEESLNETPPIFGARYDFHLEGVVDCPEFLVHLPTLVKLAEKYGLMLIGKQRFGNYFERHKENVEGKKLLSKMRTMESFPPNQGARLVGGEPDGGQYEHARNWSQGKQEVCGTLSKDEWEASTIYMIFAFKKIRDI